MMHVDRVGGEFSAGLNRVWEIKHMHMGMRGIYKDWFIPDLILSRILLSPKASP
jgi:hypothetical protein